MSVAMLTVDRERLWRRLMQLAEIGRFGTTGVDRQALTAGDLEAKLWLIGWARERRLDISTDAIGNLFVRRRGTDPQALPVAIGSHLDTEARGGRFDGAFGVVAAMELVDALIDLGIETRCPVDLVVWNNEEGCRFHPGCMGSRSHADPSLLTAMLTSRDPDGIDVEAALRSHEVALRHLPQRALGGPLGAFLEAHIEQGPLLERADRAVAAVAGIQGRRIYEVTVTGRTDHAGTVPHATRSDALERATGLLQRLYARASAEPDIRITPGRLLVEPNSPSVVPGRVILMVDIRHPDASTLNEIPSWLASLAPAQADPPAISVTEIDRMDPATFDAALTEVAAAASVALGGLDTPLISGASHDAHALAGHCPTTMVFVRCRGGVSHHEDEYASPEDLAIGTRALSACLLHACGIVSLPQPM